jgi:hypothetical protein
MMNRPGHIVLPDDEDDDLERQAVNANNIAASADGPNDNYADGFDISDNEDAVEEVDTASKIAPGKSTPATTATPVSTSNGADDDDKGSAKRK